ncbi:pyridoxamine 5'-phosphate oxidase family protein [Actinoplanes sp. LDG1-06]|uniref:Pyridoxamine 5'-phosphate oxidase family protein n=1 Tax=Paractinoplanes ovalisporus TaxID=2810368 RepID=A0ABS2A365_9ACTN|nr:pyridoxamine 5'-phosphate oxidase family protein [Actinoplanes ovalisporus]MBM2614278.1 pyridoxamine 5'-phosphate oxidase family protein [Actinoplanes ovalisporus]
MTVFHWGELEAQARAGFSERAAGVSRLVKPTLPGGADEFLAEQNMLVVGAQADDGRLWASLFTGPPGFLGAPDDTTVEVLGRLAAADPVEPMTRREGRLGLLAIDLETRIRLRMNGAARPLPYGLSLTIDQSFPNCPKYIQKRSVAGLGDGEPGETSRVSELTGEVGRLVTRADTFFVASASENGDPDVSHRGGNPGFVELLSPTRLRWPDYVGNSMLMTIGNFTENPYAGLVFLDWQTGTTLHLTGSAAVRWADDGSRSVEFDLDEAVLLPRHLSTNWSAPALSRHNPPVTRPAPGAARPA